jgi:ATP synthase protein I
MVGRSTSGGPSPLTIYAIYGAAGVQLAASVVAGMLLGGYADGKLGTAPWLLIAGIALGFAGGLVNLVRIVGSYGTDRRRGGGG